MSRGGRRPGGPVRAFLCAALLLGGAAAAAEDGLRGSWSGEYVCNQGRTGVTLSIGRSNGGDVQALFHFYEAPGNPGVPTGCFEMEGTYDRASGALRLEGGRWLLRPPGYVEVDFLGTVDPDGRRFEGRVVGYNCSTFRLVRRPGPRTTPPECRPRPELISRLGGGRDGSPSP